MEFSGTGGSGLDACGAPKAHIALRWRRRQDPTPLAAASASIERSRLLHSCSRLSSGPAAAHERSGAMPAVSTSGAAPSASESSASRNVSA